MVEVERTIQRFAEEGTPEMHGQVIWRVARWAADILPCFNRFTRHLNRGLHRWFHKNSARAATDAYFCEPL